MNAYNHKTLKLYCQNCVYSSTTKKYNLKLQQWHIHKIYSYTVKMVCYSDQNRYVHNNFNCITYSYIIYIYEHIN